MGTFVACGLAQNLQPPHDIPRVMESKFGLEFLPLPDA
jgi:hypothetical protein